MLKKKNLIRNYKERNQEDASELLLRILDILKIIFVNDSYIEKKSVLKPVDEQEKYKFIENTELSTTLELPIKENVNITDLIVKNYLNEETLNKPKIFVEKKTETEKIIQKFTKSYIFETLPTNFIITLNKFDNYGNKKLFSIGDYKEISLNSNNYKIKAIIVHSGKTSTSGHYYVYRFESTKIYELNDSKVIEKTENDINDDIKKNGYIFLYEKDNTFS